MTIFYTDEQVIQLVSDSDNPEHTWESIRKQGTPLVDETSIRMTFLFDAGHITTTDDVESVHVWINRLTDKERVEQGFMTNIPNTTFWVRTIEVPPSLRAAYCFRINAGAHRPPGYNKYPHQHDPHSRSGHLVLEGTRGLSLLQGKGVAAESIWQRVDLTRPSRVTTDSVAGMPTALYTPAIPHKDLPLVILIDADVWFPRLKLDQVLDYLIVQGHIPACAVLGVGFADPAERRTTLGANDELSRTLITTIPEYAKQQARTLGHSIADDALVIAGQSLGAFTALWTALQHPHDVHAVVASSPSLWWRPEAGCNPGDLHMLNVPWLVDQILHHDAPADALPPTFMDVGVREGMSVAHMHGLCLAMEQRAWEHHFDVYDGGHDFAWWREALTVRLGQALRTLPPANVNYN
ncbi:MAG: alpha/beta hydrolase-fold protein [Corynebacterium sp.]|nr:alpha/beta hydrolase-fold protein [Corynebacterium sp.]